MAGKAFTFLAVSIIITIIFALEVSAQIPKVCVPVNAEDECCPPINGAKCGGPTRGECVDVSEICHVGYDPSTGIEDEYKDYADQRFNWPSRFFSKVCRCSGNFDGFDCSECKFGYGGENCQTKLSPTMRTSVEHMSTTDWQKYNMYLLSAKNNVSQRYMVYIGGNKTSPSSYTNVTLYNLAVWMHHYIARTGIRNNTENQSAYNYGHGSTAFLTWHRLYLLWFEREIRIMANDSDFKLSYWNWLAATNESWDMLYTTDKLGSIDDSGYVMESSIYGGVTNWPPVCLYDETSDAFKEICNPTEALQTTPEFMQLVRCPSKNDCNPQTNSMWPNQTETKTAIETISQYRTSSNSVFNKYNNDSFSNYLEGWDPASSHECNYSSSLLCLKDGIPRRLHNLVHLLIGGTMGNVAGSPNDPLFFNHHTMIDCLLEQWLEHHNMLNYPELPGQQNSAFAGHGPGDCLVPFIPLYTNNDMFKRSAEFGYTCDLTLQAEPTTSPSPTQPDGSQSTPDSSQGTPDSSQETPDSSQETPDGQVTPPPGQSTDGASRSHIDSAMFAMLALAFILIALYI